MGRGFANQIHKMPGLAVSLLVDSNIDRIQQTFKDLGITKLRGHGRGDLIVHVEVLTPSKLNKEQEDLLEKLAKSRGEKSDQVKIHTNNESAHKGFFSRVRDAFNA